MLRDSSSHTRSQGIKVWQWIGPALRQFDREEVSKMCESHTIGKASI